MYTLAELAERIGAELVGDPTRRIEGIAPFEVAGPCDITLASDKRFLRQLTESCAAAVIVPSDHAGQEGSQLKVADPKLAFVQLMHLFFDKPFAARGVSQDAVIGTDCQIADEVNIRAGACIGDRVQIDRHVTIHAGTVVGDDCAIGAGATLYPNVSLYPGVRLGKRVIIHSGSVIGADGFGYVRDGERQLKVPQTGRVRLEDDVEIGANSCVDRATFGETVIARGVKLDNHVHVGHNCRIGENSVIVGQVGLSGSVTVGRNCVVAGHVGFVDHVTIGDNVIVMANTVVTREAPSGAVISGDPSRNHRENLKLQAIMRRLPEMYAMFRGLSQAAASREDENE